MKVQIHLKGLLPGHDDYEEEFLIIEAIDDLDLDAKIQAAIYDYRIKYGYYKIKYQGIKVIDLPNDNKRTQ